MNDVDLAVTVARMTRIAELSLELVHLDEFIESVADSSPALDAAEFRELAQAIAGVQRVAHRQLAVGAS